MRSLKFLFIRGFRLKRLIIPLIIFIGLAAAVMIFHEPAGAEDYLICKLSLHGGTLFIVLFSAMFLCADICGNRMMRSAPFSKELRTIGIPLYNSITGIGSMLAAVMIYGAYILISGQELSHLSDFLIISAPAAFLFCVMCTLAMHTTWGVIFLIYAYVPAAALILFIRDEQWTNGFGAELWVSALSFVGAAALGSVISFVISGIFYKSSDFKAMSQNITTVK